MLWGWHTGSVKDLLCMHEDLGLAPMCRGVGLGMVVPTLIPADAGLTHVESPVSALAHT